MRQATAHTNRPAGKNKRHGNMNNTLIIKLTAFLTALLCMASCTVGGDDDNEYGKGMLEEGTIAPDFMIYTDSRPEVDPHLPEGEGVRARPALTAQMGRDLGARGLAVGGEAVPLTPTEYAICEYLARHPGQVMSRAQIREAVLGWESDADDAAISMQVSRARRKLSEAGADPIATVWGMGYKWQL